MPAIIVTELHWHHSEISKELFMKSVQRNNIKKYLNSLPPITFNSQFYPKIPSFSVISVCSCSS